MPTLAQCGNDPKRTTGSIFRKNACSACPSAPNGSLSRAYAPAAYSTAVTTICRESARPRSSTARMTASRLQLPQQRCARLGRAQVRRIDEPVQVLAAASPPSPRDSAPRRRPRRRARDKSAPSSARRCAAPCPHPTRRDDAARSRPAPAAAAHAAARPPRGKASPSRTARIRTPPRGPSPDRPAASGNRSPVALSIQTRRCTSHAAIGDLPGMNQPFTVCGQFGPAIIPDTAQRSTCRRFKSGVRVKQVCAGAGSRARKRIDHAEEKRRGRGAPDELRIRRAVEIPDPDHQHVMVEDAGAPRIAKRKRRAGLPRHRPRSRRPAAARSTASGPHARPSACRA